MTRASCGGDLGIRHHRRRHDRPDALRVDRVGEIGVDRVDHERGGDRRVQPGDADDGRLDGRARPASGRRGPSARRRRRSARPPRPSRAARASSSSNPARARSGPIETIGLDGAITTTSASVERRARVRLQARRVGSDEAHAAGSARRGGAGRSTPGTTPIAPRRGRRRCRPDRRSSGSALVELPGTRDLGGHLGERRALARAAPSGRSGSRGRGRRG